MSAGLPDASPPRIFRRALRRRSELLVLGMQGLEIGIWRPRGGDLRQDDLRIAQRRSLVEQAAELARVQATSASEAGIFQNGEIELDLRDGLFIRAGRQISCGRKLESSDIKTPIIGFLNLEQSTLPLGRETHIGDPQRYGTATSIKGFKRGEIYCVGITAETGIRQLRADAIDNRIRLGWAFACRFRLRCGRRRVLIPRA